MALPAVLKGDADVDNDVDIYDAYAVLMYHSHHAVGEKDYTFCDDPELEAAILEQVDIDKDGDITMYDAYWILIYSSYHSLGIDMSWEELLPATKVQ